ncbi:MAG: hypothetical protein Fur0039_25930 [Rhodocyclaceae bacterium]
MTLSKSATAIALALALTGGLAAAPAFADLPSKPQDIRIMDTNKNGRVEKQEYLAFMAKAFDETAGAKGYCTFEEIDRAIRGFPGQWLYDPRNIRP